MFFTAEAYWPSSRYRLRARKTGSSVKLNRFADRMQQAQPVCDTV
jgi:hypothetical protein